MPAIFLTFGVLDVRDGHALAEPGRAVLLALDQRGDDLVDRVRRQRAGVGERRHQFADRRRPDRVAFSPATIASVTMNSFSFIAVSCQWSVASRQCHSSPLAVR